MYKIGFIIEQVLGHVAHGQNLKRNVANDPEIEAHWLYPTWTQSKVPVYKSNWTVHAGLQARSGIATLQQQVSLDGLFFHTQVPAVLSQKWVRRFPTIISLDATPLQYDRLGDFYGHETGPSWLEKKKWQLNVACFRQARHLVTWSDWAKQGLIDEYEVPADKISVIPPGVIMQDWKRPFSIQPATEDTPIKILFVGGDFERKGGLVLLDAFRRLRHQMASDPTIKTEIELHIVTKETISAETGVFSYNNITPNSPQLKALFHSSHLFCLPTYGDCLPMVLSEAGACGMPLISTNVAAIPEILRDGQAGFLIAPGDTEALEAALQKLIQTPELRQEMGKKAQQIVTEIFDAEKNAQELLALLKREIIEAV